MLQQRAAVACLSALVRSARGACCSQAGVFSSTRGLAGSSAATSAVKELSTVEEYEQELQKLAASNKLGVIDFTAKWCGPCKAIAPYYEQLSQQYAQVAFFKVDIDNQDMEQVVMDHGITGVPTFTFYKGPQKIETFSGARLDLLKETIAKNA